MHVGCAWSAVAGFLGPLTGCALFKAKSWTSSRTSTVFRQTVADPPIVWRSASPQIRRWQAWWRRHFADEAFLPQDSICYITPVSQRLTKAR